MAEAKLQIQDKLMIPAEVERDQGSTVVYVLALWTCSDMVMECSDVEIECVYPKKLRTALYEEGAYVV